MKINSNIKYVFIVGDLHFGLDKNSDNWLNVQTEFITWLKTNAEMYGDKNERAVIFEGDIFHSREFLNVKTATSAKSVLMSLVDTFENLFIVAGNHDMYYNDVKDINSLRLVFSDTPYVIADCPLEVDFVKADKKFSLVPWYSNSSEIQTHLNTINDDNIIVGHFDVKSFKRNDFTKIESGVEPKSLDRFKRVYLGHIHIGQTKKNIVYTGSPYQMDRGDRGDTKGIYVLDIQSDEIEEKFIKNDISPKFISWTFSSLLDLPPASISELFSNNYVDIRITRAESSKLDVQKFLDLIGKTYRTIQFIPIVENDDSKIKSASSDISESVKSGNIDIIQVLNSYLMNLNFSSSKNEQIIDRFRELKDRIEQQQSSKL